MEPLSDLPFSDLPPKALVAFTIRCARRVQPLCSRLWPDAPSDYLDEVEGEISFAESVLAGDDYIGRRRGGIRLIWRAELSEAEAAGARWVHETATNAAKAAQTLLPANSDSLKSLAIHHARFARIHHARAEPDLSVLAEDAAEVTRTALDVLQQRGPSSVDELVQAQREAFRSDVEALREATPGIDSFRALWPGFAKDAPSRPGRRELAPKALVALAVRVARRVQPLARFFWPKAPIGFFEAIENGIASAERVAQGSADDVVPDHPGGQALEFPDAPKEAASLLDVARRTQAIAASANDLMMVYSSPRDETVMSLGDDHSALLSVVSEAREALDMIHDAMGSAMTVTRLQYAMVAGATPQAVRLHREAIRSDYQTLLTAGISEEGSVESSLFGALWPDAFPRGWPSTSTEFHA